jgi:hypothetical protein
MHINDLEVGDTFETAKTQFIKSEFGFISLENGRRVPLPDCTTVTRLVKIGDLVPGDQFDDGSGDRHLVLDEDNEDGYTSCVEIETGLVCDFYDFATVKEV